MEENNFKKYVKSNRNKETRWDRIRKKHINSVNVTTENVKKFFRMNFIDEHQFHVLNGETKRRCGLNPALVMNMRHEMIRRNSSRNSRDTNDHYHYDPLKPIQMEKIKNHNNAIETKYLDHELAKFRNEITSNRTRLSAHHNMLDNDVLTHQPFDNTKLISSLSSGHESVQEFYKNSRNASLIEKEIFENCVESIRDEIELKNVSDIENKNFIDDTMETSKHEEDVIDDRYVRFGDVIEMINYEKEEINDCDNINDNHSDTLTDYIETKPFFEVTLVPKEQVVTNTILELIGKPMQHLVDNTMPKAEENPTVLEVNFKNTQKDLDNNSQIQNPFLITKINLKNQSQSQLVTTQSAVENMNEIQPVQNDIISILFIKDTQSDNMKRIILQKYFLRWIHFTTIEKISKENVSCNQSRIQKIESFLNNIRLEKKKHLRTDRVKNDPQEVGERKINLNPENPVVLARKYHNKLKIQQDIIELQKLKLERQERMISELKLSKIAEESKQSKAHIKDELKNVIRNGCANSRAKARCLQIVANVKDEDDDEYAKLQTRGVPKFLIEMEARAMERNRKHNEAKERREQLEKEKEELRIATEEAKRLQDEETKRKRIEELREKRRQEKLAKIQKENERLKAIENNKKANAFYRHMLLSRFGMNCFKMLIKIKKCNERKAEVFSKLLLTRTAFRLWKLYVYNVWNYRKTKADKHFRHHLIKKCIAAWKKYHLIQHSKMLVAIDWCDMKLTEGMFRIWIGHTKMQKILDEIKIRQSEAHYNWHLKWRVIDHWQRLQTILKIEKETEERRQRWRMKIWELLPDYTPNQND